MAAAELRAELLCSICREIYTDPVTLMCGHSFCRDCITKTFDHQHEEDYRCPECQQWFKTRPNLVGSHRLRNMAEACIQSDHEETGIFCTFCDLSVPAKKSCLQCETSMCSKHLIRHNRTALDHTLLPPITDLKKRKCPIHNKILEFYCKEDNACICVSCRLDGDHMRHEVKTLDIAAEIKREKLKYIRQMLASREDRATTNIQSLQEVRNKLHNKASVVSGRVIEHFQYVKRELDILQESVLSEISRQEEETMLSVLSLIQQLEIQKDELCKKMGRIEELCQMNDHITFLQESANNVWDVKDKSDNTILEDQRINYVDDVLEGINLQSQLEYLSDIIKSVKKGIYKYEAAVITLDETTAGNKLYISDDLCTALYMYQDYPQTPDRFQYPEVLSNEKFSSGQYYWDLEANESVTWRVGVSYSSIARKGDESMIGDNDKSWCLCRYGNNIWASHNDKDIRIPNSTSCERLRVCIDYDVGILSFYELGGSIKHLHTFSATFTEPLHVAIAILGPMYKNEGVKILVNKS